MRDFLGYWWKCAKLAARGSAAFANNWQWLIGIPAVSGTAGFFAAQRGVTQLSTGYPILDGVIAAFGAFMATAAVAFFGRLLSVPVMVDRERTDEIDRLKKIAHLTRPSSFDVFIESVSENDADRSDAFSEQIFRVGITNLEIDKALQAYVLLEGMAPELGISPAAKLPAIGKGVDPATFLVSPSETAYAVLLERELDHNGAPFRTRFAAESGHSDEGSRAASSFLRREYQIGELRNGQTYAGTLAVHAPGAVSQRLSFEVIVAADGTVSVKSEKSGKK